MSSNNDLSKSVLCIMHKFTLRIRALSPAQFSYGTKVANSRVFTHDTETLS